MANFYKPQEPLQINGDYIYPLTTIDQVLSKDSKTRLNDDLIVKSTDILSLEELEASTDLTGKVLNASAFKSTVYTTQILGATFKFIKQGNIVYVLTTNQLKTAPTLGSWVQITDIVNLPAEFIPTNQNAYCSFRGNNQNDQGMFKLCITTAGIVQYLAFGLNTHYIEDTAFYSLV